MKLNNNQNKLLKLLEKDNDDCKNSLFRPGPYWDYKTKKILYWLKKNGIENFRGHSSGVGTSFTDSSVLDIRKELGYKGRIISSILSLPLINKIFNLQLNITKDLLFENIELKNKIYSQNEKIKYLIKNYNIENSNYFGCVYKTKINNQEFSTFYLDLIERIDNICKIYDLNKINSIIEIGGGFGGNIHLLLQNFPNIKKIIYVDIFPNIFIGTEYLKYFYKDAVKDYTSLAHQKEIRFNSKKNELEILCIPSWSIEKINDKLDKFHNAASFQEMTVAQVENYKTILESILSSKTISLIVYKGWEKNNTLSPDEINSIFDKKLKISEFDNFNHKEKLVYLTY